MDEQVVSISAATTATEQTGVSATLALPSSRGVDAFLNDLAQRQCTLLEGIAALVVVRPMRDQPAGISGRFEANPVRSLSPRQYKRLTEIGASVVRDGRSTVEALASSSGLLSARAEYRVLAAPLMLAGQPQGAAICVVPDRTDDRLRENLTTLELSTAAFEAFMWRQQAYMEAEAKIQMREVLDLLDTANQGHDAREVASLFCSELQRRFGCTRVSIGLVQGHAIRTLAIGGSEHLDRRSEMAEALEAAMEECADQDAEIRFPQPEEMKPSERRVVRGHASLSERFGPCAIASFPLRVEDGLIGIVVMERRPDDPFTEGTLRLVRLISEYLGPVVWTRRLADRGILAVSRDRTIELAETVAGPTKTGAKLFAAACLLLLLVSVAVPVSDRSVADGRVIAEQRRQVSPPFPGRLDRVYVRPGTVVQAGVTPLFELDTREIRLQLQSAVSERDRLRIQADESRAKGETSSAAIHTARMRSAEADVQLHQRRLEEALVKAPIDGIVTRGELDDLLGEVVQPHRPLMEVAQLDTIAGVVLVTESGIARVRVGQAGALAVTARPAEKIAFRVARITPAAEVYEQRNVYRVDVEFVDPPDWVRPGMEGQARIRGNRTNLFTIYTRPLFDAIRLRLWW